MTGFHGGGKVTNPVERQEKADLLEEIQRLKDELAVIEKAKTEVVDCRHELSLLKTKLSEATHAYNDSLNRVTSIEDDVDSLASKRAIVSNRVLELEGEEAKLVASVPDARAALENIYVQIRQGEASLEQLKHEIGVEKRSHDLVQLRHNNEVKAAQDKIGALNVGHRSLQADHALLQKRLGVVESKTGVCVKVLAELQEKERVAQENVKNIEGKLVVTNDLIVAAESKHRQTMKEIEEGANRARNQLAIKEREIAGREENITWRENNLSKKQAALKDIKSQLEEIHGKKLNHIIIE